MLVLVCGPRSVCLAGMVCVCAVHYGLICLCLWNGVHPVAFATAALELGHVRAQRLVVLSLLFLSLR